MTELVTVLQEKSAAARWRTIARFNETAEAKLVDPTSMSILTEALADEHAFVRWQAGLALASQARGQQKLVELLKDYPQDSSSAEPTSEKRKTDLICSAAIDALVDRKSAEVKSYLINPLLSGDAVLRQSAAEALARQGHPEAIPYLITTLKDNDPWVRRAAALALGHVGDVSAVEALIQCLQDKAVIVRRSAAYALGALRSEAALSALKISTTDQDVQVRRNAAWALGRIRRPEAVNALTRLLDDADMNGAVAATAREAITTITKPRWQKIVSGLSRQLRR
jgi:HEAT repeat protein